MYQEKCELNQIIKDNANENELRIIWVVIHQDFGYPLYEIAVK